MKAKFFRKKNIIQIEGRNQAFKSINAAKRESRKLQKKHGQGSLIIVEKLPSIEKTGVAA